MTDHALISNIVDDDDVNKESRFDDNDDNVDLQTKVDCLLMILWE